MLRWWCGGEDTSRGACVIEHNEACNGATRLGMCTCPCAEHMRDHDFAPTAHPALTAATLSCGAAEYGVEMLQEGPVLGTGPLMVSVTH